MPIDPLKPPDPILEEFCTLTGMSSEGLKHSAIHRSDSKLSSKPRGRPKGVKNRVKHKVLSPGSASVGAGAILKRLRNSKVEGKGRSRSESSPLVRNGKRPNSSKSPVDDVLAKVLDKIAYDKNISNQMVFREGSNDSGMSGKKVIKDKSYCSIGENDGSFINKPIEPVVTDMEVNRESMVDMGDDIGDSVDPLSISNNTSKLNMADGEHGKDESIRKTAKDVKDDVGGNSTFVFGDVQRNKGILNRPPVGLTKVHFGPSLFYNSSNVWSSCKAGVNAINIESFAEKMKKGAEDRELQMNFVPQFVSTQSDGTKRIAISMEDIKKGSEACALQLYGYFVGTSMDYRVVYANLSRMWRAYGISDITKTRAGLFYFKFKNEEFMKAVLDSGPWMVNNVPLVLNVWELGIWLDKVEPSTIPIWVRPKSEEEIAAKVLKEALNVNKAKVDGSSVEMLIMKGGRVYNGNGNHKFGVQGLNQQDRNVSGGGSKKQSNVLRSKGSDGKTNYVQRTNVKSSTDGMYANKRVVKKGDGSKSSAEGVNENVPVNNSFQAFADHDMVDNE
ncbi:hypothetical protein CTI12_AA236950 [Artemisia annua]|uniref:DUF4283 domain-containing protein n=1 Tax=Artemisia annua TaxID=35608 RepID=A0A2U1NQZ2_ARTAN|nr:hypothetical protein CTI12_AA236950 [Artemisia annua]